MEWQTRVVVQVVWKEELSMFSNYINILILCIAGKIYTQVAENKTDQTDQAYKQ